MTSIDHLGFRFVEAIPETPSAGVVYISPSYATSIHLCACGCGSEVVLPLAPSDWSVLFDGESVSFSPSVWNRRLPCGAHYWIKRGIVQWVGIEIEAPSRSLWHRIADRLAHLLRFRR